MPTKEWIADRQQVTFWMKRGDYEIFVALSQQKGISVAEALRRLTIDLLEHEKANGTAPQPRPGGPGGPQQP